MINNKLLQIFFTVINRFLLDYDITGRFLCLPPLPLLINRVSEDSNNILP